MIRSLIVTCVLALSALLTPSAHAQDSLSDYWERLRAAHELEDWDTVILNARILRTNEAWPQIPSNLQSAILTFEGEALFRTEDPDAAREILESALAISEDGERAAPLFYLMMVERQDENWPRVAVILLEIQEVFPAQIDNLRFVFLNYVLVQLERDGETALYEQLLEMLVNEYEPTEAGSYLDWLVTRHIRVLLARGEVEAARAQLDRVIFSTARIRIRTSKIYQALWSEPGFDALTDPVAGEEATLQRAIELAEGQPLSMAPINDQVRSLTRLGRLGEATALAEKTLQTLFEGEPYEDATEETHWMMNELAILLYAQNRAEEANDWMERSSTLTETGGANVSQVINFSTMLMFQGRFEQALQTLDRVGDASPYGDMWVASVRACSNHQLGRSERRDDALAVLEAGWEENPSAYQRALVCVEALDAAAELMVTRLNDPLHSGGAMDALQRLPLLIGRDIMPLADEIDARFTALKQRPEIVAAAAEHGRIESFELYEGYLGSF